MNIEHIIRFHTLLASWRYVNVHLKQRIQLCKPERFRKMTQAQQKYQREHNCNVFQFHFLLAKPQKLTLSPTQLQRRKVINMCSFT